MAEVWPCLCEVIFLTVSPTLILGYHIFVGHETITLQGLPLTVKAAHMKLSHSRMPFVRTYFRETQELVFDAHDKAFLFYGGVCRRGLYDKKKKAGGGEFVCQAGPEKCRLLPMCSPHLIATGA